MNRILYTTTQYAYVLSYLFVSVLIIGSAFGQQRIVIDVKNKPLMEIIRSIEQQSGHNFVLDQKSVNTEKRISLTASGDLKTVLRNLERQAALDIEIRNKSILVRRTGLATIDGIVTDEEGKALPSVSIYVRQWNQFFLSDNEGKFKLTYPVKGKELIDVTFAMVGRRRETITIETGKNSGRSSNSQLRVSLPLLSIGLEEVAVAPATDRKGESNSSLIINREMIEQSGALSLGDLLNFVPGKKIAAPSLQEVKQATLRSASLSTSNASNRNPFDLNSSFGVAIIMDGIAISNNANMQTRNPGISGMGESFVGGSSSSMIGSSNRFNQFTGDYTFGGTDLRQIAVDNIESVEIVAGVSSAKYGDMTDGAIIVNRLAGKTPLNFQMQLRDNATTYGLNKGFQTKRLGAFTVGANFTRSYMDNRDKLKSFDRIASNLMWTTAAGRERAFTNTFSVDYGQNLDNVRRDPDDLSGTMMRFRTYNFSIGNRTNYRVKNSFLTNIALNLRYSQNYQNSYQEQQVNYPYVIYTEATEAGFTEGQYGPGVYTAVTNIEGKPVSLTSRLDFTGKWYTGEVRHQLNFGASYNYAKNLGRGQLVDPDKPRNDRTITNPSLFSARYYDFSRIHAQQQFGVYLEDVFAVDIAGRELNVRVGTRLDKFDKYWTFAPRTNIVYEPIENLRVGAAFGWSSKAPAMAQIYPGPLYYDIVLYREGIVVSDGSIDGEKSVYPMYVDKYVPDNSQLKPSKSNQFELTVQHTLGQFNWGITGYRKQSNDGLTTVSSYEQIWLPQYLRNPNAQEGDLPYIIDGVKPYRLTRNAFVNGNRAVSSGIEWNFNTPKWQALQTSLFIRGGYVVSKNTALQNFRQFDVVNTNPDYAATGIYPTVPRTTKISNMSLTTSTHIPKAKLLINFISEFNFLNNTNSEASDGIPLGYYTLDGRYYAIDNFDVKNENYGHLLVPAVEVTNNQKQPAVYTNFHLNLSKEISKRLVIAFNVYNVFNYRPQYKRSDNTMIVPNSKPSYGAQLRLKL